MKENKGTKILFKIKVMGGWYHFGFSNEPSGPGYLYNDTYYGRPCLYLGILIIQLPFLLNGKIYTAGEYTIRWCNKRLK